MSIGLLLYRIVVFGSIFLLFASWILLIRTKELSYTKKMLWFIQTLIFPIVGPLLLFILFLIKDEKKKKKN
jgi:hypothetical protein